MIKRLSLKISEHSAKKWKRFTAYLIDMAAINFLVISPFEKFLPPTLDIFKLSKADPNLFYITTAITAISLLYFVILEYKIQQTLGKLIFSIQVKSLTKQPLSLGQVFIRNLTKPFPIVLLIDVLYMFFKRTDQRLLEKFSYTYVTEEVSKLK